MLKNIFLGWLLSATCCAQVAYYDPQHIIFPPGKLVRLWIRDRAITHLIGIPEHVVWSLERGSLFFESSLGCSFCVYDEFLTPYDITASPQNTAKACVQLDARDPMIDSEHIRRFLLSDNTLLYQKTWRNTSCQSVPLAALHAQTPNIVVIARKHHIAPYSTLTYFAVPKTALAHD